MLEDEILPPSTDYLQVAGVNPPAQRASYNDHYGFYQNQDQITERNEMSECLSQVDYDEYEEEKVTSYNEIKERATV